MKYPAFLKEHGTIGFVAPSFGCATEPYKSAFLHSLKRWEKMGYHTELGENCFSLSGVGISNTPASCGRELTEYYVSENNDCLISCGGGELMCEILEYVDFEKLKAAKPKWYMGYSDNTNFTYLLTTICDTASIYGPCAASFGMEPWHPVLEDSLLLLKGEKTELSGFAQWEKEGIKDEEHPLAPYHCTEPSIQTVWKVDEKGIYQETCQVEMQGRLLGGCLDCLTNLSGTEFDHTKEFIEKYKEDGIIWFLEACDINVFSIRRALWQLKHTGWFQYTKGFLFGRPRCGEEMFGLTHYDAVLEPLKEFQVPIVFDMDLGHLPPSIPIICGSFAKIKAGKGEISLKMEQK